jgi:predicted nucleic acid-binding protein
VFADAWYYLALLNKDDVAHERVLQWSRQVRRPVIVTDFVLVEVGNALSFGPFRAKFVGLVRSLRADANTTVLPASRQLLDEGLALFAQREDKEWSLTDCISFVVMRQHGIVEALTGDHHFEQAGSIILPT